MEGGRVQPVDSSAAVAVTSYHVPRDAVEGDCGGLQAVRRLPPRGAFVILIAAGGHGSFPPRPRGLSLRDGRFANYECFGTSTMFRFRVGARTFQAHVGLGRAATDQTREQTLAVLGTIGVAKGS